MIYFERRRKVITFLLMCLGSSATEFSRFPEHLFFIHAQREMFPEHLFFIHAQREMFPEHRSLLLVHAQREMFPEHRIFPLTFLRHREVPGL